MAVVLSLCSGLQAQGRIAWVESWAEAQLLAQRHRRLILVHFWSQNCSPCVTLERSVFNQPEVIRAFATNYVPLKVNVDQNRAMAEEYRIDRWPTDVILTADGRELYRGTSPQNRDRYIATLDQIAAHARLGLAVSGSPSTQIAAHSPAVGANRASAFPTTPRGPASFTANQPSTGTTGQAPHGADRSTNRYAMPTAPRQTPRQTGGMPGYGTQSSLPGHTARLDNRPQVTVNQYATQPTAATVPPRAPVSRASAAMPADTRGHGEGPSHAGPPRDPMAAGRPAGAAQVPAIPADAKPGLAMDGYCPVTLVEQEKWVKGDVKWGAIHRGRTYLFTGPEQQRRFLANFAKYAPVLSGFDPIKYAEEGKLVDGKRAHGVFYRGQIFLFSDEAALQRFWGSPERYAPAVRAEQQRHAMRQGNPQR